MTFFIPRFSPFLFYCNKIITPVSMNIGGGTKKSNFLYGGQSNFVYFPNSICVVKTSSFHCLCTKISFCFGGLIMLFQLVHTPCKFTSYHHTREPLKRVCLCTLLSPRLSLSLSLSLSLQSKFFSFRFFTVLVL